MLYYKAGILCNLRCPVGLHMLPFCFIVFRRSPAGGNSTQEEYQGTGKKEKIKKTNLCCKSL